MATTYSEGPILEVIYVVIMRGEEENWPYVSYGMLQYVEQHMLADHSDEIEPRCLKDEKRKYEVSTTSWFFIYLQYVFVSHLRASSLYDEILKHVAAAVFTPNM